MSPIPWDLDTSRATNDDRRRPNPRPGFSHSRSPRPCVEDSCREYIFFTVSLLAGNPPQCHAYRHAEPVWPPAPQIPLCQIRIGTYRSSVEQGTRTSVESMRFRGSSRSAVMSPVASASSSHSTGWLTRSQGPSKYTSTSRRKGSQDLIRLTADRTSCSNSCSCHSSTRKPGSEFIPSLMRSPTPLNTQTPYAQDIPRTQYPEQDRNTHQILPKHLERKSKVYIARKANIPVLQPTETPIPIPLHYHPSIPILHPHIKRETHYQQKLPISTPIPL